MSLPPIQDTPTDCERLALIAHLARAVSTDSGRAVTAMTGGSALRLCHGLTRPSFDLDLDVSERRNWLGTIRKAIASSPWHHGAIVDRKQGGRGPIRIVVNGGAPARRSTSSPTRPPLRTIEPSRIGTRTTRRFPPFRGGRCSDGTTRPTVAATTRLASCPLGSCTKSPPTGTWSTSLAKPTCSSCRPAGA